MYQVFDKFLATETWYKSHAFDDGRFYTALANVVGNDGFNADAMGEYFRTAKKVNRDDEDDMAFNFAIDRRVTQADAIYEYLRAAG